MRIVLASLLLIPSLSFAGGSFESNGYLVSTSVSSIARNLYVEGRINGNDSCKNLVITADVKDKDGQVYAFKTDKFEYKSGISLLYETQTAHIGSSQSDVEVISVNVTCADPPR